jgi:hypothetical protein
MVHDRQVRRLQMLKKMENTLGPPAARRCQNMHGIPLRQVDIYDSHIRCMRSRERLVLPQGPGNLDFGLHAGIQESPLNGFGVRRIVFQEQDDDAHSLAHH